MKLNEALAKMVSSGDSTACVTRKGIDGLVRVARSSEHLLGHRYVHEVGDSVTAFDATLDDLQADDWTIDHAKEAKSAKGGPLVTLEQLAGWADLAEKARAAKDMKEAKPLLETLSDELADAFHAVK